jgi:DNA adenine methylase
MLASPLKRIGGKHTLAQQLLKAFPSASSYTRYVEPCGGAAWVLLARQPGLHKEVFNDLDDLLVNFWETLRDQGELLRKRLDGVLYSRYLYYKYYRSLFDGTNSIRSKKQPGGSPACAPREQDGYVDHP